MTEGRITPALIGDGKGVYRIRIVGNSGTGKSTLADELGEILGLPVIHLDRVFWKPGWVKRSSDEFRNALRILLDECDNGWVVDGNYTKHFQGEMDNTTDVIWLDTPFLLYFPRIFKRTILRLFGFEEMCAPGCGESIRSIFFSKNSILWWTITNHTRMKCRETERLRSQGVHVGGNMRRIGGWGSALSEWKSAVQEIVKKD